MSKQYARSSASGGYQQPRTKIPPTGHGYSSTQGLRTLHESFFEKVKDSRDQQVAALLKLARLDSASPDYVNLKDGYGLSPLHWACWSGSVELMKTLCSAGAGLNQKHKLYGTPLCVAALAGRAEIVATLLNLRCEIQGSGLYVGTALHAACRHGHVDVVNVLLECGCNLDTVSMCLDNLANIGFPRPGQAHLFASSYLRCSSMPAAIIGNRTKVVDILLTKGANLHGSWSTYGEYVPDSDTIMDADRPLTGYEIVPNLWKAIDCNSTDVAMLLIARGSMIDLCELQGADTPLMAATKSKNYHVAKALLDAGADVDRKNNAGQTAVYQTVLYNHRDGVLEMLKLLLARGASPRLSARDLSWPIHMAAQHGRADCIVVLLDSGSDVDPPDAWGQTPLMRACQNSHINAVRLLLQRGGNVNLRDRNGCTALYLAVEGFGEEDPALLRLLLSYRADPKAQTNSGRSPLTLATYLKKNKFRDVLEPFYPREQMGLEEIYLRMARGQG